MVDAPTNVLQASPLVWALDSARLFGPKGATPFVPYPYQAALLADRSPHRVVLKSRQVGITQVVAVEMAHELVYRPRSLILVVSRDQRAAESVIGMVLQVFDLLDSPPGLEKQNQSELLLQNGSRVVSQAATSKAGRGLTATSVYLDEFAFCDYDERIYRAVSPTLSRGGRLTVVSTPNGQDNLFYRLWNGAEGGDWSRHRVHWRDCPVFDDGWYERERPKYTNDQWASEFDLDFVGSGDGAFDAGDVDAMAEGWDGLQPPLPDRRYVTGWDIGRRRDPTVGVTVDVTEKPWQVVAYERLIRAPFAVSQSKIDERAGRYSGAVWVESNGIGDPVIEALECRVKPFITTAKSKADALTRLVRAVEQGAIKCGVPQILSELKGYRWDDANIVQDSVMALAIALHAVRAPSGLRVGFASKDEGRGRAVFAGARGRIY